MNNDSPKFAVHNITTLLKLVADSGTTRRVVELPEFAQHAVSFETNRRDFSVHYHTMRDGRSMPQRINIEQGEILLVNEMAKEAILAHEQNVKMFFTAVRPVYTEEAQTS